MEKSKVSFNAFSPDHIENIDALCVKQDIESDAKIFTAVNMTTQLFISDTFKSVLKNVNIVGFKAFEADGWNGLPI